MKNLLNLDSEIRKKPEIRTPERAWASGRKQCSGTSGWKGIFRESLSPSGKGAEQLITAPARKI